MKKQDTPRHVVIGTAGHIDHGKTALVKALTGTDTDRLSEEKRRGITIELGFAFYGDSAAFVDVPGHERFVKTMVAGASAMSAALLVIAADDGVMPQTREHLAVLDAMGIKHGIVAVTKADLADRGWIELVVEEAKELVEPTSLKSAPVYVVDSISGQGIDELKAAIDRMIGEVGEEEDPGFFRMPVDRSFIIKGYGRVITGTVWSGELRPGEKLYLLPKRLSFRVRGIQAHEKDSDVVRQGDRAALNLVGEGEPERGDVLLTPGRGVVTDFLDVRISLLPDAREVKHRMRIRLHIGTDEVIGRLLIVGADMIPAGHTGYARIALETKTSAMLGDRGVLRLYSPLETLGGVLVLDPSPPDRRRTTPNLGDRLRGLHSTDEIIVETLIASRKIISTNELKQILPWSENKISENILPLISKAKVIRITGKSDWFVNGETWKGWKERSAPVLKHFHEQRPEENGMPKGSWCEQVAGSEIGEEVLDSLISELADCGEVRYRDGLLALPDHTVHLRSADREHAGRILELLQASGINPPLPSTIGEQLGLRTEDVRRLMRALKQVGRVILLDERIVVTVETVDRMRELLQASFPPGNTFTVGAAAEALSTTRKYVVPLLEYLDREGFSVREGDRRRILGVDSEK